MKKYGKPISEAKGKLELVLCPKDSVLTGLLVVVLHQEKRKLAYGWRIEVMEIL